MPDPIISARNLVKVFRTPARYAGRFGAVRTLFTRSYTTTRAVADISFSVDAGELVGYLGPNGAGKSTTIKMLTGILEPTSGEAEVAGVVPWGNRQANALNIGVVFGQRSQLWWDLPLVESFELVARMYHIEPDRYRKNLAQFREILALGEFIDMPVRQLSLGQRMRGELTAALLHDPAVVYLDEPTVGLDVVAKERIRTFVADINRERGATVVLTTHDLADVERLCSRVILIDHGRVLFEGSVDRLKATYAPHRELVVQLIPDAAALEAKREHLEMPGVERVDGDPGQLRFRFDPATVRAHELVGAVARRYPVTDLALVEPELESVVRRLYERPDEAGG